MFAKCFTYIGDLYCNQLTKFLANFHHVRTIELCGSLDKIIIPKKQRDHLVPPLYAMKHLVLFAWGKGMKFRSVELLEYMLWLCPQVESLWIKTGTSSDNVETEIVSQGSFSFQHCTVFSEQAIFVPIL